MKNLVRELDVYGAMARLKIIDKIRAELVAAFPEIDVKEPVRAPRQKKAKVLFDAKKKKRRKLEPSLIQEVLAARTNEMTTPQIVKKFGISKSSVARILKGKP